MKCLICDKKAHTVKKKLNNPLVWKCRECGFQWVDRNALGLFFDEPDYHAYPYNEHIDRWFNRMRDLYYKGFEIRVERTLGEVDLRQKSFLDIGCANGEYLRIAKDMGFGGVSGIEIDDGAISRAERFGNVWRNPAEVEGRYDVIQIKNVLSNISDFRQFFQQSLTFLKPGGYLYLDILNEESLTAWVRRLFLDGQGRKAGSHRFGHLRPPYVINGFTLEAVRRLLAGVGMVVRHEETTYCGSVQVPYSSTLATKFAGIAGSLINRGPMLVVEASCSAENRE